ncbi:MAG: YcaO-like family protein, partial [Desulfobacterales bacterium]|nr:YcaO-like family protein [Desulfobacterales bacterium]
IELSGNYDVRLLDCSLDLGFPVVGAIFVNKIDQTYFIKFGSHPTFEIAAERTLTELLQGQDVRNMRGVWDFSFKSNMDDEHKNLINIFVNGCGWYPPEFFKLTSSYNFKPFNNMSNMTNKEMLKYMVNIVNREGYDVYVRDVSFLGFPAFHVIVPGLSEVEEIDQVKELNDYADFVKSKKLIRKFEQISDDEIEMLAEYLESKDFSLNTSVFQILNSPIQTSLPWFYIDTSLFITALYCKKGDYSGAHKAFNKFFEQIPKQSFNQSTFRYYKCVRDYLAGRSEGYDEVEIIKLLTPFYPLDMVNGVIHEMGNPERVLAEKDLVHCFNCKNCRYKLHCQYKNTERVFKALKDRYASSKINQKELVQLLHE